jgi:hypothetical protein
MPASQRPGLAENRPSAHLCGLLCKIRVQRRVNRNQYFLMFSRYTGLRDRQNPDTMSFRHSHKGPGGPDNSNSRQL